MEVLEVMEVVVLEVEVVALPRCVGHLLFLLND